MVCLSTAAAEFVAATEESKDVIWMRGHHDMNLFRRKKMRTTLRTIMVVLLLLCLIGAHADLLRGRERTPHEAVHHRCTHGHDEPERYRFAPQPYRLSAALISDRRRLQVDGDGYAPLRIAVHYVEGHLGLTSAQ